jgi:type IV secretory pathway TrbD component
VTLAAPLDHSISRHLKFRQAAFAYLHVALLREAAAYEMWRAGLLPYSPLGSPTPFLILGGIIAVVVFFALLRWHNVHFVRFLWFVHAVWLFPLIRYAFFAGAERPIPRSFYMAAIVAVMIAMWALARAGWDL